MGKFNKLNKRNKALQLEIVPKDQDNEVQLPEVRKSDDVIPKKVKKNIFKKPHAVNSKIVILG